MNNEMVALEAQTNESNQTTNKCEDFASFIKDSEDYDITNAIVDCFDLEF